MTAAARTSLVRLSAAEVDTPEAKTAGWSEWAELQTGYPHAFLFARLSAPAEVDRLEARMDQSASWFATLWVRAADDTRWAVGDCAHQQNCLVSCS